MKTHTTLLTACLLSAVLANGQTTNSSTSGTTTSPGTGTSSTTPSTTNSTYSTTPSSTSDGTGSTTMGGTLNSTSTTTSGTTAPTTYGTTTTTTSTDNTTTRPARDKRAFLDYKNFVFGLYAGLNTTRFAGEDVNGDRLTGRLGYQAGFFVRGGGRLYGQLGAEYFASSSNFFTAGSGTTATQIRDQINIQYVQIPVYIGYKLTESDRGISAVRVQIGLEYANRINSNSGDFNLSNSEIKSGTFNGLGQIGFDAGPVLLDLTYHYGFGNSIEAVNNTGFAGSARRILSASIGFKF